jgi:hypothetical protein
VHQRLRALFGLQAVPSAAHVLLAAAATLRAHARALREDGRLVSREALRGVALAGAYPLGQYLGARSADTGRELLRARGV